MACNSVSIDLEECVNKGMKGIKVYATLKDGTKPCCESCIGTKQYAVENGAGCYLAKRTYLKFMDIEAR